MPKRKDHSSFSVSSVNNTPPSPVFSSEPSLSPEALIALLGQQGSPVKRAPKRPKFTFISSPTKPSIEPSPSAEDNKWHNLARCLFSSSDEELPSNLENHAQPQDDFSEPENPYSSNVDVNSIPPYSLSEPLSDELPIRSFQLAQDFFMDDLLFSPLESDKQEHAHTPDKKFELSEESSQRTQPDFHDLLFGVPETPPSETTRWLYLKEEDENKPLSPSL